MSCVVPKFNGTFLSIKFFTLLFLIFSQIDPLKRIFPGAIALILIDLLPKSQIETSQNY